MSDATGVEAAPSVLLSFRAENARSFRDPLELSLLPTAMAESEVVREVPWREGGSPIGVLPVAGVLGANASGKSNLLRIMDDMRRLVLTSFRLGVPTGGIERHPFRLDGTSALPTRFEVDLIVEGIRYEYGFSFDDDRVLTEWAFYFPKGRAKLLFERNGDDVDFGSEARRSSRAAFDLLRPNALFLSTAASANHPALLPLFEWFHRNLLLAEVDTRNPRQAFTAQMLDDPKRQEGVLALLRAADLGITGAIRHEIDPKVKERVAKAMRVLAGETDDAESDDDIELGTLVTLTHRSADGQVPFGPAEESLGTLVWFGSGPPRRRTGCEPASCVGAPPRAALPGPVHEPATSPVDLQLARCDLARCRCPATRSRPSVAGREDQRRCHKSLLACRPEAAQARGHREALSRRPIRRGADRVVARVRSGGRTGDGHQVSRQARQLRRQPQRAPRHELLVFTEGEVTEVQYLKELERRHRDKVVITIDHRRGVPVTLMSTIYDNCPDDVGRAGR